jgi:hypothetical protein
MSAAASLSNKPSIEQATEYHLRAKIVSIKFLAYSSLHLNFTQRMMPYFLKMNAIFDKIRMHSPLQLNLEAEELVKIGKEMIDATNYATFSLFVSLKDLRALDKESALIAKIQMIAHEHMGALTKIPIEKPLALFELMEKIIVIAESVKNSLIEISKDQKPQELPDLAGPPVTAAGSSTAKDTKSSKEK